MIRNKWLALGKNCWQKIFVALLTDGLCYLESPRPFNTYNEERIGKYDYKQAQVLRSVCQMFACWISPRLCLEIIYMNPAADTSPCIILYWNDYFTQIQPGSNLWEDKPNPYFKRKHIYLTVKWKWRYNWKNKGAPVISAEDEVIEVWRPSDRDSSE